MSQWDRRSWESPGADKAPQEEEPDTEQQAQKARMQSARHKRGLQRKAEREAGPERVPIPSAGGAALDGRVRKEMEGHLGGDLSAVRVHTGGESAKAATSLGARAFTDGQDVHFNAGQFAPGSKEGDRLLAHELTHVVQGQKSGIQRSPDESKKDEEPGKAGGMEVSKPEDEAEVEADKMGDKVAADKHEGGNEDIGEKKGEKQDEKKDKKKKKKGDKKGEGKEEDENKKEGPLVASGEDAEHGEPGHQHEDGDEKAAGGEDKAGGDKAAGGDKKPEEKPAAISAKYVGVGRKIFREAVDGQITDRYSGEKTDAKFEMDPSKSQAENPKFESDAKEYEGKLGSVAFGKASGIGAGMVGKVKGYLAKEINTDKLDDLSTKAKEHLAALGGVDPSFAGSVGDPTAVLEVLKTKQEVQTLTEQIDAAKAAGKDVKDMPEPPNVREQMTLVYNFATKILLGDLLKASEEGKVAELVAQGGLAKEAVEKRVNFMKEQQQKKQAAGKADAKASSWDMVGMVPADSADNKQKDEKGADTGKDVVSGDAGAGKTTQAVADQGKARDKRADVETKQQTDKGVDKKDAKTTKTQTDVTAGEAKAEGVGLSDREAKMMGDPADSEKLKWSEGAKTWVINEKDKWVQAMRGMSLPLAAGPSGTTNVLMNANAMLGGVAPVEARVAAIGYLLPIHAHSLVEVCAAAAGHGVPFTAGQKIYKDLAGQGFEKPELDGIGRPGADGKKLYPDDPDATAAGGDAKAQTHGAAPAH